MSGHMVKPTPLAPLVEFFRISSTIFPGKMATPGPIAAALFGSVGEICSCTLTSV